MVLDVYVEGCDVSYSSSYSGFGIFRCEILRGWNQELGELYDKKYGFLYGRDSRTDFAFFARIICDRLGNPLGNMFAGHENIQEKIDNILNEYDKPYNIGMKLFAKHSDCDGEFTPDECVLILKAFGRVDPEKFDNTKEMDNEFFRESYDIWQQMLTYAIENNQPILFG